MKKVIIGTILLGISGVAFRFTLQRATIGKVKGANSGIIYLITAGLATMTNGAVTVSKINELMEELFPELTDKNGSFLFYFSGHGHQRYVADRPLGYLVFKRRQDERCICEND